MRSSAGDWRTDSDADGATVGGPVWLVSSPPAQTDTASTSANATPEQPSFVQQFYANQIAGTLNDLFGQPAARRPAAPANTGNNVPNGPAQTGGGAGVGGASTPNAGGGGAPSGGGGAGPAVTNASQWLTTYLGAAGGALTSVAIASNAVAAPTAAPTAAAAPAVAGPSAPPPSVAPSVAAPSLPLNAPPPAQGPRPDALLPLTQGPSLPAPGGDPLYVLDTNTGETVPANVPLNTFSNWGVNLLAQVSGASVLSYSWDTSQAPDLTDISGQNGPNLQGAWANFSGAARTDTLTVTETPQSGTPLSQTMTFLVASTSSPAYAVSSPTSSATWPSVVTPDTLSSQQATQPGGPHASLGLTDGSVRTSFSMPSYNPNTTPVSLDYNSTTANAQPIFLARYQLPLGQAVPATLTAQLTFNGTVGAQVVYNTSSLNPGDWVQIALQANATTLPTGRYPWQITITNGSTPTTYSGDVNVVNQANSAYGAGWSLDNVEQLIPVSGGVILVQPGGTSLWFAGNGQGGFTSPAGDFSTLVQNQNGTYTRTLTDGTQINFNGSGQETSRVDTNGNTTTYAYTGGLLSSITDRNGQVTTLAYNGAGQLTTITDPANRTATLAYSGNRLTSITDPAGDVWQYAYDASNDLTTLTDPNDHATTFAYNFADRVASVTQPDGTTEELTAEQMNGLAAPGTSTPSNPATAVLLATGDQAQYTDANSQVWMTNLDWLGFGLDAADIDPLGDASLNYINTNGLVWLSADALGRATRDFFDSQGNVTEEVAPDNTTQEYQYNPFGEVTQYTDQEGNVTTYAYNTQGDLTRETDALGDITEYAYNTAGLLTSETDPNGNTTTYAYNTLNEQTSTTNALGGVTTDAYDSAGDLISSTDALGDTSTFAYDPMGRLTSQTLPDTPGVFSTTTSAYDKVGNQISSTDPNGHTTTYAYNTIVDPIV